MENGQKSMEMLHLCMKFCSKEGSKFMKSFGVGTLGSLLPKPLITNLTVHALFVISGVDRTDPLIQPITTCLPAFTEVFESGRNEEP